MSVEKAGVTMFGVNEDAYWDQYQVTHDPQWQDNEDDDFLQDEEADREIDERLFQERLNDSKVSSSSR